MLPILWRCSDADVPQEFLKHAVPDDLVRGTDLFSPRLSNKKKTRQQKPTGSLTPVGDTKFF